MSGSIGIVRIPPNKREVESYECELHAARSCPHPHAACAHRWLPGEPFKAEGVQINSYHFGESAIASEYNRGRTLTHEVGHYLGLLHLWGAGDCASNDFCADTPPVAQSVTGCSPVPAIGCGGVPVMAENYMTWSPDHCMSTCTRDQVARMRHVLETSPRRRSLLTSPALPSGSDSSQAEELGRWSRTTELDQFDVLSIIRYRVH